MSPEQQTGTAPTELTQICSHLEAIVPLDIGLSPVILWSNEDDARVLVRSEGKLWLIAEDSSCGPMEPSDFPPGQFDESVDWFVKAGDGFPFKTWGDRWFINLTDSQMYTEGFNAREGEIQGLAYAVLSLMNGGKLEPESYEDYIVRLLNDHRESEADMIPLTLDVAEQLRLDPSRETVVA